MHTHCRCEVRNVMGGRRWDAVAKGWRLHLRAVGGGAALFDNGVELADGFVYVSVGTTKAAGSCGGGIGATTRGRR